MKTSPPEGVVIVYGIPSELWPTGVVKYSGPWPIPSVGDEVKTYQAAQGIASMVGMRLVVQGYAVEHEFMYLLCSPLPGKRFPKKLKLTHPDYIYIAGIDLVGRKMNSQGEKPCRAYERGTECKVGFDHCFNCGRHLNGDSRCAKGCGEAEGVTRG